MGLLCSCCGKRGILALNNNSSAICFRDTMVQKRSRMKRKATSCTILAILSWSSFYSIGKRTGESFEWNEALFNVA